MRNKSGSVCIDPKLLEEVSVIAREDGRTVKGQIEAILKRWLKQQRKQ